MSECEIKSEPVAIRLDTEERTIECYPAVRNSKTLRLSLDLPLFQSPFCYGEFGVLTGEPAR